MSVHVVPVSIFYRVFAALLCLTALTTAAAFFNLGPLNNVVAIGIAMIKASLVALFFMNMRYTIPLTRVFAVMSILFLLILFAFTFGDYDSRTWQYVPMSWISG